MKTKIYSVLFFALLFVNTLYFNSCKPDETPVCGQATNTTINFTPAELSKVPYNGHDTLYFKDISGDTNIVVGGGKQFYYDIQYTTHGGPACPPNVTNYQAYKIQFTPIKGDLSFSINPRFVDGNIRVSKNNYNVNFFIEFDRLIDSSLVYGGIPISNNGAIDNTYICSYSLKNGLTHIKSQKENEEFTIFK